MTSRGEGLPSTRSGGGIVRARRAPPTRAAGHPGRRANATRVGGTQVEGRHAVRALLTAGTRRVLTIWLSGDGPDEMEGLAEATGARVHRVDNEQLAARARTDAPQGVVAEADPLPEARIADLLRDPRAFLVALDGVTDPQNLGAVIRAAEAAGATGILLPRHRAARVTPTVAKAAAGAIEHLPIATVPGIAAALDRARRENVWTVGLDEGGETSLFDLPVADQPLAVVLGAEGHGISRLTRTRCDLVARIVTRGATASLNVAAAATLACFEVARRRSTLEDAPE
jgi:23S rRNA (guanosine2251-2'-O)-methyltransferase